MLKSSRGLLLAAIGLFASIQSPLHAEARSVALSSEVFATLDDPSQTGPLAVASYSSNLASSGYQSAIIYIPEGAGPFPATTLTPGFTNTKEDISWLGQHLASHGIITIVFTPTNIYKPDAQIWANGHVAAIETLKRENSRVGSPLAGLVDIEKMGLTGYSFGAAGSVVAANQLKDEIKAVVALNAYRPVLPRTAAPYLFVVGKLDNVAIAGTVGQVFKSMTTDGARAFANMSGLDHYGVLARGNKHAEIARMATAWLKNYLGEDSRYMTYINGPELDQLIGSGNIFASASDYVFVSGE